MSRSVGRWLPVHGSEGNWYLIPHDYLANFRSCDEDGSPKHDDVYRLYLLDPESEALEDLTFTDPRFDV